MIILMGQTHDDVLYFENILRKKYFHSPLFKKYPMISGTIFNQEVLLVYNVVTSYVCGLVAGSLNQKYNPTCFILLGKCKGVTSGLKRGEIAISSRIIPLDVDQCEFFNVKVGQIPGIEKDLNIMPTFLEMVLKVFESTIINGFVPCGFLSANKIYSSKDELYPFGGNDTFFGKVDNYVLDSDCISTFLACDFYNVPFISVKVIDSVIGVKSDINDFVRTLDGYSKVGKSITSLIGEIGRKDLVK